MKTKEERQEQRRARRAHILAATRHALRPLDADDRDALAVLIHRAAEILSDGEITQEEHDELAALAGALREARSNTP